MITQEVTGSVQKLCYQTHSAPLWKIPDFVILKNGLCWFGYSQIYSIVKFQPLIVQIICPCVGRNIAMQHPVRRAQDTAAKESMQKVAKSKLSSFWSLNWKLNTEEAETETLLL